MIEYYHASQVTNLDETGIFPNANPHVSRDVQDHVYLGSLSYVTDQYLKYAKSGQYHIYQVDTTGLKLDKDLPGEQVRTAVSIDPSRVELVDTIENEPDLHPRELDYRKWMKELGKE